jgi:hypothetical protein
MHLRRARLRLGVDGDDARRERARCGAESARQAVRVAARGAFASWDAFRVRLDDGENATVLQFGRRNGLDWRLVGVDLPADALTR